MTLTQYYTATSLDGFIADEKNSLQWLFDVPAKGHQELFAKFLAGVGPMAMGATTYLWIFEHEGLAGNPGKWREWYDDRPAWVFTHRDLPEVPGADVRFVRDDVRPVHAAMVDIAEGRNIWLIGGGELVGQFADHGLLDELILSVAPVTLGSGAALLPRRLTGVLELIDASTPNAPFVELRYRVGKGPPA
jgi:dihydrofolate reductase